MRGRVGMEETDQVCRLRCGLPGHGGRRAASCCPSGITHAEVLFWRAAEWHFGSRPTRRGRAVIGLPPEQEQTR